MHRMRSIAVALSLVLAVFAATLLVVAAARNGTSAGDSQLAAKISSLSRLPVSFEENRGQHDAGVRYTAQGTGTEVRFSQGQVTFVLGGGLDPAAVEPKPIGPRWAVNLDFVGAAPVEPIAGEPSVARVSYFRGPVGEWLTGVPTYSSLSYPGLWPGVDLSYEGAPRSLKYAFHVAPGADPARIRLAYQGAESVYTGAGGELQVKTPAGGFTDAAPVAWQDIGGRRVDVPIGYDLRPEGSGRWEWGFHLGAYDTSRPLVIDPAVISWAGFIGGIGLDHGRSVEVDSAGNIYVVGVTESDGSSFPVTGGPVLTYDSEGDAFVAKIDPTGTQLLYAGYLGGEHIDVAHGVDVDAAGNAYVVGATKSFQRFPRTVGPALIHRGAFDGFITKIDPTGTQLLYSGFIGGGPYDSAHDVVVDDAGNAYVAGMTKSSESKGFPLVVGPDLTFNGGGGPPNPPYDAFVSKVKADGTGFEYSGYIGGNEFDGAMAIDLDASGAAYVAGVTESTEATFPATVGPDQTFNGGGLDVFAAKVAPDGSGLAYAGYIGGASEDAGFGVGDGVGIAVDPDGSAYVTGQTGSTEATFPVTVGPDLTYNGNVDAFITKLTPDGSGIVYSGYIGGAKADSGVKVALDEAGNAFVVGETASDQGSFPVAGGPDLTFNGGTAGNAKDAFIAKVDATGSSLQYAGYIGGAGQDLGRDVAVDDQGDAYVVGITTSGDGFPAAGGPDLSHNGNDDVFIAKISETNQSVLSADLSVSGAADQDPARVGGLLTYTLTVANAGPDDATNVSLADALPSSAYFFQSTTTAGSCAGPTGKTPGGSVICGLGMLPAGASATVIISVIPSVAESITNQATAAASVEQDPNPADNSVATTTQIEGLSCTIIGSPAKDTITTTDADDVICGLGGNDVLKSMGGNDTVYGGPGNDSIFGGAGNDTLYGDTGLDVVNGGAGADALFGGADDDPNLDSRDGVAGNDSIDGGAGTDTCRIDAGDATVDCP